MKSEIPFELIEQIHNDNCAVFIGAGLSMNVGLPGWKQLLSPLCSKVNCSLNEDPLKIAQVFEFRFGRPALISHIKGLTDTAEKRPSEHHFILAKLFKLLITTNYDNFIERAFQELERDINKIVNDKHLSVINRKNPELIKLHGDRDLIESFVITRQDFYTHFSENPLLKNHIINILTTRTILFIGYSFSDPDFNQIQAEIAFNIGRLQRRAYAVLFDADDFIIALCVNIAETPPLW